MVHEDVRDGGDEGAAEDDGELRARGLGAGDEVFLEGEAVLVGGEADDVGVAGGLADGGLQGGAVVADVDDADGVACVVEDGRDVGDALIGRGEEEFPPARHGERGGRHDQHDAGEAGVGGVGGPILLGHEAHQAAVSLGGGVGVEPGVERGLIGHAVRVGGIPAAVNRSRKVGKG